MTHLSGRTRAPTLAELGIWRAPVFLFARLSRQLPCGPHSSSPLQDRSHGAEYPDRGTAIGCAVQYLPHI
jgi:hypothetical protein